MKVRTSLAAAGAAAVLGIAGALALPAMASAHDASTTLKFDAETVNTVGFTKTTAGFQATDVNHAGKTIGYDVVYLTATGSKSATLNVALDVKGGLLYGTLTTTNNGKTYSGTVTGGTGAFSGATGTIKGKAISSTETAITITYST
jgi:hypothetical protein